MIAKNKGFNNLLNRRFAVFIFAYHNFGMIIMIFDGFFEYRPKLY